MTAPVGLAEQDISASMQDGVVRVELPRKPKKLLREEKKVEVA